MECPNLKLISRDGKYYLYLNGELEFELSQGDKRKNHHMYQFYQFKNDQCSPLKNPIPRDAYYLNKPFSHLQFLQGPVSLTYFANVRGKRWFLFGDNHKDYRGECLTCDAPRCYKIEQYLENAFITTKCRIDFYHELDYQINPDLPLIAEDNTPFNDVRRKFHRCFQREKREQCQKDYPNVRFHYTDIRQFATNTSKRSTPVLLVLIWEYLNEIRTKWESVPDNLKEKIKLWPKEIVDKNLIAKYLKAYQTKLRLGEIYQEIVNQEEFPDTYSIITKNLKNETVAEQIKGEDGQTLINKILVQLKKIKDESIKDKIKSFYEAKIEKIVKLNEKLKLITNEEDLIEKMALMILFALGLMMDIYVLGRIFREDLQQDWNSKEIWIYAGDFHIQNYVNFIEKYLGVETGKVTLHPASREKIKKSDVIRCLNYKELEDNPLPQL